MGFEPRTAGCKAQTNPLGNGGPPATDCFDQIKTSQTGGQPYRDTSPYLHDASEQHSLVEYIAIVSKRSSFPMKQSLPNVHVR